MPGYGTELIESTGFVYRFNLELRRNAGVFYRVVLSDVPNALQNATIFEISRGTTASDQGVAVSWNSIAMAAIATLKDAYFREVNVTIVGSRLVDSEAPCQIEQVIIGGDLPAANSSESVRGTRLFDAAFGTLKDLLEILNRPPESVDGNLPPAPAPKRTRRARSRT